MKDRMTDELSETPPPLPPPERQAGNWAWPLILLSVFFIGWSVNLFSPGDSEGGERTPEADPADLALLKIQSQVVIAAGAVSPADAKETIEELKGLGGGDRAYASIALLESFLAVRGADPAATAEEISEEAPEELRRLVRKAISEGISEGERATLKSYVGWFADLAPGAGLEAAPEAEAIRMKAMFVLLLAGGAFLAALCVVPVGAILLFLKVRKHRDSGGVCAFRRGLGPRGVMLECFALYLGIMAMGEVLGVVAQRVGGTWADLMSIPAVTYLIFGSAVIVPFLWPALRGVSGEDFRRSLGFHTGEGFFREVAAGVAGYAGVIAIASVGVFLTLMLTLTVGVIDTLQADPGAVAGGAGTPAGPTPHPIVGWIYSGGWKERMLCLLLAAGFAPFFEEIFFRGALQRYLRGHLGFIASALIGGVIFAALHPQGWMGIPALAAMGIGFSLLREWRDSLIAPMVAHAINNGALVTILCLAL
jgi:membrane protease YdiL (CAAX protease family)